MSRTRAYSISELAEAAGTTPRTVRFYTAEGLLPPPDARGRFARYSEEHLDRLRLIARLKEAYQPLNAIRERLERVSHSDVRSLLADNPQGNPTGALDDLLVRSAQTIRSQNATEESGEFAGAGATATGVVDREAEMTSITGEMIVDHESETWQRVLIASGIELQIRLPLDERSRKNVEEVVRIGKRLFDSPV